MALNSRPAVLVTVPDNRLKGQLFDAENIALLEKHFHVSWNLLGHEHNAEELRLAITGVDAVITAWGTHPLTPDILDAAPSLRFVGHTGGTIKWLVDEGFFDRGIPIVTGNAALAPAISEYCLMVSLMHAWNILFTVGEVSAGRWLTNEDVVDGLNGKTIGLIGYGLIAREFARLLRPFDVSIRVFSRHCDEEEARRVGFSIVSLEEALDCDIVSLHSTLNDQTRNMLDAGKLALIRDGALFLNTARAALVEESALMDALAAGRFKAVLDVFHQEPLPAGHPLRSMPNVLCTPHIAGANRYWRRRQADIVIEDLIRVFSGKKPENAVTREQYARLTPV